MAFIPAFEIGVWNAWILMVLIFLYILLTVRTFKNVGEKITRGEEETKFSKYVALLFFILLVYSVFLPLPLGTAWFYTGLALFLIGLIITEVVKIHWATTPLDQPITRGLYRYSRHPAYVAAFLQFIGVGIASASWLFLLLTVVSINLDSRLAIPEERYCLEKYGDSYREYTNKTPRWIGIPKSLIT